MKKAVVALLAMSASSSAFAKDYSLVGVYDCNGTQVSIAMNSTRVEQIAVGGETFDYGNDTVTENNKDYGLLTGQSAHNDVGRSAMLIFSKDLISKGRAIFKFVGSDEAVMCNLLNSKA